MAGSVSIFLITFITLIAPRTALPEEADREAEVRAAVNAFGHAFVEADVPTLEHYLSENYVHVNGGSGIALNRDDWLKFVKSRRVEIDNGELVVSDYRIEDVKVVLDGNTAIVIGMVYSSQSRNGNSNTSKIRFSNTWLYREGVWRRAAFHDSPLP
jgi:ketosteroid isomerase-like protein